jgi:Cu(I)/Ag(I) efflux system membrane protein CusA/SilA
MIDRIIEWSAHARALVLAVVALLVAAGVYSMRHIPLVLIRELSDTHVIV